MTDMLSRLSDRHLQAVYRVAKTRLGNLFRDPRNMIILRAELLRRNLELKL